MARKITKSTSTKTTTEVRNTAIPRVNAPAKAAAKADPAPRVVTQAMIAQRAYEIWQSGKGGSELENWLRAERELKGA